jgi:hypothetical protein
LVSASDTTTGKFKLIVRVILVASYLRPSLVVVGDLVGASEGANVSNATVGPLVVGLVVGDKLVGTADGADVGPDVGEVVGATVGLTVGEYVSCVTVGPDVEGALVETEGAKVGLAEATVGVDVTRVEGEEVNTVGEFVVKWEDQ